MTIQLPVGVWKAQLPAWVTRLVAYGTTSTALLAALAVLLQRGSLSTGIRLLASSSKSSSSSDIHATATQWLAFFSSGFTSRSGALVATSFLSSGWLRDALVFTWDTRSINGRAGITAYLSTGLQRPTLGGAPSSLTLDNSPHLSPRILGAHDELPGALELAFVFETPRGKCRGLARLKQDTDGSWRALSVFVMLDAFHGHEEAGPARGVGGGNGEGAGHAVPWEQLRAARRSAVEADPYVLVVGAGQTGLQVAARLTQLGVRTIVLEKAVRVGDQWRARYRTLALHSPRSHHTMLYQPYLSTWPVFTPREKLADWMGAYVASQDLVVWTSSYIMDDPRPAYDASTGRWTASVWRAGELVVLHPAHIILATGTLGPPAMPSVPGADIFSGEILHASAFSSAEPFIGKRVLVVGAANTAADVCEDLYYTGARAVTMLQRASACVVSVAYVLALYAHVYPEGVPLEVGIFDPWRAHSGCVEIKAAQARGEWPKDSGEDARMKEGLRKKGYRINEGPRGLGVGFLVVERFAGHFVDTGFAQLIIEDKVALKAGCEVAWFTADGVVLTDGSALTLDAVIFATGYESPRGAYRDLFGADVIDPTTEVWGLDAEGEVRGAYRPSGHPGLWYTAGDFFHSRWGSKQLGLLIQAVQLGYMQ